MVALFCKFLISHMYTNDKFKVLLNCISNIVLVLISNTNYIQTFMKKKKKCGIKIAHSAATNSINNQLKVIGYKW